MPRRGPSGIGADSPGVGEEGKPHRGIWQGLPLNQLTFWRNGDTHGNRYPMETTAIPGP